MTRDRRRARACAGVRRRARPPRASSRCCSRSPPSPGGRRRTAWPGWTRARDRAGRAGLVPRRLGRDDGGDDVPVGGADGLAVRAHEPAPERDRAARVRGRLPRDLDRGGRARLRALRPRPLAARGRSWRGTSSGAGWRAARCSWRPPTSSRRSRTCAWPSAAARSGSWSARGADGLSGALNMGARHGAWCVGCCWALMASLFALGVMSLAWMAFVAALIALEKTLPWGRAVTYATASCCWSSASCCSRRPDAVPGLTVPGDGRGHGRDADALTPGGLGDAALILADDLTGAADCGVQALRRGLRATVSLPAAAGVEADVLAIDLDTRDGAAADARERTRAAARDAAGLLYVKLDSRLRGHIGAAIEGALDGRGRRSPSWRPHSPAQGRIPAARRPRRAPAQPDAGPCGPGSIWRRRGRPSSPVTRGTTRTSRGSPPPAAPPARRVVWAGSAGLAAALFEGMRAGGGARRRSTAAPGRAVLGGRRQRGRATAGQLGALLARPGCVGIAVDPGRCRRGAGEEARRRCSRGGGDAVLHLTPGAGSRPRARAAASRRRSPLAAAAAGRARGGPPADRGRDRARGVRPCGPDRHRPDRRSRAGRAARAHRAAPPGVHRHEVGRLRRAGHARRRPRRHQGARCACR